MKMVCSERDYLRDFDFADFPLDDKLMKPGPQSGPVFRKAPIGLTFGPGSAATHQVPRGNAGLFRSHPWHGSYELNRLYQPQMTSVHQVSLADREAAAVKLAFSNTEYDTLMGLQAQNYLGGNSAPVGQSPEDLFASLFDDSLELPELGLSDANLKPEGTTLNGDLGKKRKHSIVLRPKKRRVVHDYALGEVSPTSSVSNYSECSSVSSASASSTFRTKQKRTKWLEKEVRDLWEGIAMHGNNWRLIKKKSFGHRTYYQVKDKGRRILASKGWSSGRTKVTHDGAAEEAKNIAKQALALLDKEKAE